jgi:hypothetical protein
MPIAQTVTHARSFFRPISRPLVPPYS